MPSIIESIRSEYLRYKRLAESAIDQLDESDIVAAGPNSIATICWHISGNLKSRFTDFLTSDGEKPWRQRDTEFEERQVSKMELMQTWEVGWRVLFATLDAMSDDDLATTITIRQAPMPAHQALARSLAHISYHVGQIVYAARELRGDAWQFLSISPGGTDAYNRNPDKETGETHAAGLGLSTPG